MDNLVSLRPLFRLGHYGSLQECVTDSHWVGKPRFLPALPIIHIRLPGYYCFGLSRQERKKDSRWKTSAVPLHFFPLSLTSHRLVCLFLFVWSLFIFYEFLFSVDSLVYKVYFLCSYVMVGVTYTNPQTQKVSPTAQVPLRWVLKQDVFYFPAPLLPLGIYFMSVPHTATSQ